MELLGPALGGLQKRKAATERRRHVASNLSFILTLRAGRRHSPPRGNPTRRAAERESS